MSRTSDIKAVTLWTLVTKVVSFNFLFMSMSNHKVNYNNKIIQTFPDNRWISDNAPWFHSTN